MKIKVIRQKINAIDKSILRQLGQRAKHAEEIGKYKVKHGLPFHDPKREEEVIDALCSSNKGHLDHKHIRTVFTEIMSACLSLQKEIQVVYLGPEATYTHIAAMKYFGSSYNYIPVKTIADVFATVEKEKADFGVVPIENSTEGIVNYTLDIFMDSDVKIYSEILSDIHHNLLSKTLKISEIKKLYTHPQTLAQCRTWIEENLAGVPIIELESNARAAEKAAKEKGAAAIASDAAAQLYGLHITAEGIEDVSNNMTRFLVISRDMAVRTKHSKTSILFSIKDRVGALYEMLKPFREAKINLTKIESRPTKKKAWEYVFFVDLLGHVEDEKVMDAIRKLEKQCLFLKVLGSYPYSIK